MFWFHGLNHIYNNELDKACFAHDTAYSDSKDLAKITVSDKVLKDRVYENLNKCKSKYDDIKED